MKPPPALQILRWLFFVLMLLTGGGKLMDMSGFAAVVGSYQMLPAVLVAPAAWTLMLAELILGLWLLSGLRLRAAAIALVLMHLMYLVWTSVALMRGLQLPNCGCFGVYWAQPLSWLTPVEDLVLLALAIGLVRAAVRPSA